MITPDMITGGLCFGGASFTLRNIWQLWRDKRCLGVHWTPVAYFALWGVWNLYYYPSLDQWWAFAGGCAIVTANTIWLFQMLYYGRKNKWAR